MACAGIIASRRPVRSRLKLVACEYPQANIPAAFFWLSTHGTGNVIFKGLYDLRDCDHPTTAFPLMPKVNLDIRNPLTIIPILKLLPYHSEPTGSSNRTLTRQKQAEWNRHSTEALGRILLPFMRAGFDLLLYPKVPAIHSSVCTYSLLLTNVQIWGIISCVISNKPA